MFLLPSRNVGSLMRCLERNCAPQVIKRTLSVRPGAGSYGRNQLFWCASLTVNRAGDVSTREDYAGFFTLKGNIHAPDDLWGL